ncbi:DUF1963 domain-containing protein [Yinghuangia soli]|uniref:DUF1963 domain-containing protein n=1 Tax=Yinghuangia soli TaxID=2908204 RepID=A0AA41U3R7_9ACTN|nr:DUF1963 domain-containing protein [Yinghuangia soli]MCF2532096.1 DUF1963 domain-containing protein [Yinghuangia soli]
MPLVPVVQVYARDLPASSDVPFPPGTDLLQVLWCPFHHAPYYGPMAQVFWRDSADVSAPMTEFPEPPEGADGGALPVPCVLHPERVMEYPSYDMTQSQADEVQAIAEELEKETGWSYWYDLSVAPGVKLGGYPGWTQDPQWPRCACGRVMDHLITVESNEFDGEDSPRWIPVEDQAGGDVWNTVKNPTDLVLGDAGGVYVFVCSTCPGRPYETVFDCS